jgi:Flp pilus assembly protein TadD/4-amino-4-deoxy-L-arabinose transferase-like glycosyltransferase
VKKQPQKRRRQPVGKPLPPWAIGAGIFALAVIIRIIYILQARANPQFAAPMMDAGYHDEWAWQLAQGTWESGRPFFRAPLYPMFLSAIYSLGGHNFLLPRLIQAFIGAGSCLLLYLIGRRIFSPAAGLIAGVMMALYGTLIYFDNELLIPGLFIFLILTFFRLYLAAMDESPRRVLLGGGAGLAFGLAAITRPNILIYLPVLLATAFPRLGFNLSRVTLAVMLICALIPVGAVTVYNATAGGDAVLIASQGGVNFYIGNNDQSDGRTAIVPGTRPDWWGGRFDTIQLAEEALGHKLKDSEVSEYWLGRAFEFIKTQPGDWLSLTARKFGLFWTAAEIGNNSSISYLKTYAPIMKLPWLGFGLVAPLGLAGLWLALRDRNRHAWLGAGFIILYMAGVVTFFVCARFRLPIVPFLILFAGYAIARGAELLRDGALRTILPGTVIFLAAALMMNVSARGFEENIALAKFHDGIAWKKLGELGQAERSWREALRLDPNLTQARNNLANLLSDTGDRDLARQAYEAAITADPRNAAAHANLASWHLIGDDLAQAQRKVADALAIDADHSESLRLLGVILEGQNRFPEAREAYERALQFTREAHRIENNLASLAMKDERLDEAREHLGRAIELKPDYALAWMNLGVLHANEGDLAEAESALRRAIRYDPRSWQAWDGLSQVLNALGKTSEAAQARAEAQKARGGR